MRLYRTTQCIVCLDDAVMWSGHVRRKGKSVTAGWCGDSHMVNYRAGLLARTGCHGGWHKKYGMAEDDE